MFETDRAVEQLQTVIDESPAEPVGALARARAALDRANARLGIESYRLSLEGLRALERGALSEADAKLSRAVTLAPYDLVARYRYARVLERRGDQAAARAEIDRVIDPHAAAPAIVRASALVDAARFAERDGDRSRARALYRSAADVIGADPQAHDDALHAIARLAERGPEDFFDF
jgi:tetratricopeptide (TPR) repeat protein